MLIVLIATLLLSSNASAYLSYGDASDDCNWTATTVTLEKAIWNCDDLTVANGTTVNVDTSIVTDPIQLRVQGDADIDGIIRVSASGTTAGPGGSDGGTCSSTPCSSTATDAPGSTGGEGNGGGAGDHNGTFNAAFGGGGGGAGFSANGSNAGATPLGTNIGQTAGSPGTGGSSFFSSSDLDSSLRGGVGGGAGGSGGDGTFTPAGGAGGAGSGSLLIVAKGDIILRTDTLLEAKGGTGSVGTSAGGAQGGDGGSGSGGVIYIVTSGNLTLSGTPEVEISGGDQQTGGSGGPGGSASVGILRVDTASGSFSGSFTLLGDSTAANTNTASSSITDPLSGSSSESLVSDISPSCTYKEGSERLLFMLLMSFLISLSLFQAYKLRW
ncbi:MAG: hypothetical protein CME65_15020 [Halobacteriovoraceae bacterium]|nr:hypothetical protein [Halobacteriovoraceae bacterium]|tara:strand:+ start:2445 stop:3593 length:1149 start_codon:yes stop_codon:yes gene_type:complete